nr:integrase, catalytic region, zinc finger, CCHC-type, peptidase aspartic, catalytic [Tanacetum cinerariifolium]
MVVRKLKDRIKSLSGNVKKDIDEIETVNIELEHRKNVIDTSDLKPSATIDPGMFKLDIEPISHRLKNNREAYEYLDSGCSKHMTENRSQLINFVSKFLGTVRFENDHIAKIMGYGDYQMGNVTICRVYFVEGLGHNLFSVGQFCDSDLEVAFRKQTCFIHDLEVVIAPEPTVSTSTPSSATIDQDAPSTSTSQTTLETSYPIIPLGVEEADHDIEVLHMDNNPYVDFLIPEPSFEESSSQVVIPNNVYTVNQPHAYINKWTKDHLIDNVTGDPFRSVSTRHQLQDEALLCYFDAFLSFVKPKSYKEALIKSCWIKPYKKNSMSLNILNFRR